MSKLSLGRCFCVRVSVRLLLMGLVAACLVAPVAVAAMPPAPALAPGLHWSLRYDVTLTEILGLALVTVGVLGLFLGLHSLDRMRHLRRVAARLEGELAERRRAEARAQKLLEQSAVLQRLALAVAALHTPQDVLRKLHEQVRQHTSVATLAVTRLGHGGETPKDVYLPSREVQRIAPPIESYTPAEVDIARRVSADGQPAPLTPSVATGAASQMVLMVPISLEDGGPGVLRLYASESEAFSETEINLLSGMASLCSVALRNARLFAEAASRAQRLSIVNRVASAVGATLDLDRLMETVHQELASLFSPDAFLIGLYLAEAEQVDYRVLVDEGVRDAPHIEPIGQGLIAYVVHHDLALLTRHASDVPREGVDMLLWGTGRNPDSWLGVPMHLAGRVVGVISVQAYRPDAYGDEDAELLATIADQIAVAVENARLYEAERREMAERQLLEAQLREARKMEAIGQLAGGIAHDFNNLLMVINGYSQLALSILASDDPVRMDIQEVLNAGERAAALTRQLLAFSRRQVLEFRSLDFNGLIENLRPALADVLKPEVELQLELTDDPWLLRADAAQLEQVVRLLVQNAVEAMPEGGVLTLSTHNLSWPGAQVGPLREMLPGDYAVVQVRDTGVGMSEEVQKHLFEPFFTTRGVTHTGLGLATVYGTVKQSNGHVSVESLAGRGAAFSIYLPRVWQEAPQEAVTLNPAADDLSQYTLLLVEDEEVVREMTYDALTRCGYAVLQAKDGDEALRLAGAYSKTIHLMLTDVVMPRLSGPQVAVKLHSTRPEMRVLYMSGYADDAIGSLGVKDEAVDFLQKPFAPTALLAKVSQILTER